MKYTELKFLYAHISNINHQHQSTSITHHINWTKTHRSSGLQYKIIYKKGSENSATDALSRKVYKDGFLLHLSQCTPVWIQEVKESYLHDYVAEDLLTKLPVVGASEGHFTL